MGAEPKRGICPVCNRSMAVTLLGGMRDHGRGGWCKGTGQQPLDYVNPDAEAEERGYRKAIADLRDGDAFWAWYREQGEAVPADRVRCADFLESRLTKEGESP